MIKREDLKNDTVYYTFYMDMGNVRFRKYSGLVKVRRFVDEWTNYFEIIEAPEGFKDGSSKLSSLKHEINYHCHNFYESWDEAAEAHDREIIEISENCETEIKESLYKKLILLEAPKMTELESESIEWYENLTEREREYLIWIKYYYSKV